MGKEAQEKKSTGGESEESNDTFEVITPKGRKVKFHSIAGDLKRIKKKQLQDEVSDEKKEGF